jgi:hypothetical protein
MSYLRFRTAILVLTVALASRAGAGIVDSPLPELLPGVPTFHVFSVPGITRGSAAIGVYFSCTSLDTAAMQVGVELFGSLGGAAISDAVGTSLNLAPGGTVLFGTAAAAWVAIDSNIGGGFTKASARILATSKKLSCTAFLADPANVPPTSMTYLTIIAKTKQKAFN